MASLPDWRIQQLCEDWRTTWRTREGLELDLPLDVAGPLIAPFDPALLGPASIDMRVGMVFASPTPLVARFTRDGAKVADAHPERRTDGAWSLDAGPLLRVYGATGIEVELQPGQNLACVSAEYYRLPPDVEGQLFTKSSRAREWITHSTATLIHPGFCGEIAFELHYTGQHPYVIRNGMRLVQIAFSRLEAPVEAPYFARIGAHYRGQRGEVRSRDPEGLA